MKMQPYFDVNKYEESEQQSLHITFLVLHVLLLFIKKREFYQNLEKEFPSLVWRGLGLTLPMYLSRLFCKSLQINR